MAPPSGAAGPVTSVPVATAPVTAASPQYVLRVGDVVQVKVYQEDDLTQVSRIGSDGTISIPLLGSVKVVSNSVDAASAIVRELLAKDYLVNPQVSLNVTEFAKRRFTVLGQVQRPGSLATDFVSSSSTTLLRTFLVISRADRIGTPLATSVGPRVAPSPVFKTGAFNRSATSPAAP